jgi:hypothetical protein
MGRCPIWTPFRGVQVRGRNASLRQRRLPMASRMGEMIVNKIRAALVTAVLVGGGLAFTAAPAAAVPAQCTRSVGNLDDPADFGAVCSGGTGQFRAAANCVGLVVGTTTPRTYTVYGPWVNTGGRSMATCAKWNLWNEAVYTNSIHAQFR